MQREARDSCRRSESQVGVVQHLLKHRQHYFIECCQALGGGVLPVRMKNKKKCSQGCGWSFPKKSCHPLSSFPHTPNHHHPKQHYTIQVSENLLNAPPSFPFLSHNPHSFAFAPTPAILSRPLALPSALQRIGEPVPWHAGLLAVVAVDVVVVVGNFITDFVTKAFNN